MSMLSVLLIGCLVAVGSAIAGCAQNSASPLATQAGTQPTAEDHLATALMYEKQAQQLELEALKFEEETARIQVYEDPKGFRRSALTMAAQRCRKELEELKDLAGKHRQKAEKVVDATDRPNLPVK